MGLNSYGGGKGPAGGARIGQEFSGPSVSQGRVMGGLQTEGSRLGDPYRRH